MADSGPKWMLASAFLILFWMAAAETGRAEHRRNPRPAGGAGPVRIDLSRIGFTGLSLLPRLTEDAGFTVHFVDNAHLLVTWNRRALLTRSRDCLPSHEDRVIHAAILRLPDGRAMRQGDWYVHDRRAYLWPLGGGKFLFRNLSTLYELDGRLEATQLLHFPDELLWTTANQDGS